MPLLSNIVKGIEVTFPLSFLRNLVLKDVDSKTEIVERYNAETNNNKCILDVKRSDILDSEVSLTFILDFLQSRQKLNRGQLKCSVTNLSEALPSADVETNLGIINDEPNETVQKDANNDSEKLTDRIPRKRGRPKGSTKSVINKEIPPTDTDLLSANNDSSKSNYRLRGVKLSSKIMKLEKSSFDEEEEDELSDGQDVDTTPNSDNKSFQSVNDNLFGKENLDQNSSNSNDIKPGQMDDANAHEISKLNSLKEKADQTRVVKHLIKTKRVLRTDSENDGISELAGKTQTLIRANLKQKMYACVICDNKLFPTRHELKTHELNDHKNLTCSKCDNKVYKHIHSLKSHCIWIHGKNSNSKKHLCHLCSSRFKFANSLKQHIEEIHEGISNLKCKVCGKSFYKLSQLRRHEKIHGDAKTKLRCEKCGQGFWHESNRQRHIRLIHMKPHIEKFHCPYCGKGFTHKAGMISHIKLIHMNLLNFRCSECSVVFARSKLLVDHMVHIHNVKDFKVLESRPTRYKYNRTPDDLLQCSKCSQSFCYKAELIEHMHTAHADSFSFVCVECKQGFMQQHFLNRHRKIAHNATLTQEEEEELETSEMHNAAADISEELITIQNNGTPEDAFSFVGSKSNIRYVVQNDTNLSYDTSNVSFITADNGNIAYLTSENDGEVTFLKTENVESEVMYSSSESGNVTYVTNVEYENLEEVETSLNLDANVEMSETSSGKEMIGERLVFQVEDGDNTVSYVIQQSKDGETQDIATEDIAELLLAAKRSGTISSKHCDRMLSNYTSVMTHDESKTDENIDDS
ncbi:zinc finger protein 37 [Patella vulgata]|uniref:zinc finger protein 37 n=1 Tax=Patella vulgata TaxID=6465 RepID=UPI00217FFD04|nr:zinc finger protein 37 [Patella vulgata]